MNMFHKIFRFLSSIFLTVAVQILQKGNDFYFDKEYRIIISLSILFNILSILLKHKKNFPVLPEEKIASIKDRFKKIIKIFTPLIVSFIIFVLCGEFDLTGFNKTLHVMILTFSIYVFTAIDNRFLASVIPATYNFSFKRNTSLLKKLQMLVYKHGPEALIVLFYTMLVVVSVLTNTGLEFLIFLSSMIMLKMLLLYGFRKFISNHPPDSNVK